jgi:predicted enzyme related to lactoylglutathione lyase
MTSSSSERPHYFGHGRLSYVQVPALDVAASAAFYKDMFGWTTREGSAGHLSFTDGAGETIGAFVTRRAINASPGILFYVYVHGFDATFEKMKAAGSKVIREPYLEGDVWVATLLDPAGNVIGIWQRDPR